MLERQIGALMTRLVGTPQQNAAKALGPVAQGPLKLVNTVAYVRQLAMMVKAPHLALAQLAWRAAAQIARGMDDGGGRD